MTSHISYDPRAAALRYSSGYLSLPRRSLLEALLELAQTGFFEHRKALFASLYWYERSKYNNVIIADLQRNDNVVLFTRKR